MRFFNRNSKKLKPSHFLILIGCYIVLLLMYQLWAPSFDNLEKDARLGNPKSQFLLGYHYDIGKGIVKNPQKAIYWYREAAKQGYSEAKIELAYKYLEGLHLVKDTRKAVSLLQEVESSTNDTDGSAAFNLSKIYFYGYPEVPKNKALYLSYIFRAAQKGCSAAYAELGY